MVSGQRRSGEPCVYRPKRCDIGLSDLDLLSRYLGIMKVPCIIRSPLRDNDRNPSFSIRVKDGTVLWKDFALDEGGGIIDLLMRLWDVDYGECIEAIVRDEGGPVPDERLLRTYFGPVKTQRNSELDVRVRPWNSADTEYWRQFGVSRKMCLACDVHPISTVFFRRRDEGGFVVTSSMPADRLAYAFFEWKDGRSLKVYQPLSKRLKWLSTMGADVWQMWRQCFRSGSDRCIITSSRKDAMCLWSVLGIPSMAMQSESTVPSDAAMDMVRRRFRDVWLWYDNDHGHADGNPGQDHAAKLAGKWP